MRNALVAGLVVLWACGTPAPAAAPVSNTAAAPPVDDTSLALVIVVDRSGSMMGAKMEGVRDGVGRIAAGLPAGTELAVIAFDTTPVVVVPLTADREVIATGVAGLEVGGGTQFLPALVAARELLGASSAPRKHVVFLSDGEAAYDGVEDAARALAAGGATVSTIAVPGADRLLLERIAAAGGGRAIVVDDATTVAGVLAAEVDRVTAR
jgi:Mg-chelatase subunit ChlD